jgi:peptidoglycan hydrolase-like amidase
MTGATTHEPLIAVGILEAPRLLLSLEGSFVIADNGRSISGAAQVRLEGDGLALETESGIVVTAREVTVTPGDPGAASFLLRGVVIGKEFHWERAEDQRFRGGLRLTRNGPSLSAVNVVGVENYLTSVISSEMSSGGALEFLKAHAVTSRSWLLAQLEQSNALKAGSRVRPASIDQGPGRLVRWYDREDHDRFDVCADDHCQRYQGITRPPNAGVTLAVSETRGLVLMSGGEVCDARFSKCCGGVSELFENVWEPDPHSYLGAVRDAENGPAPDLTSEAASAGWIRSSPPSFCNVSDPALIGRILPQVDRETADFYRWTVSYTQEELAALISGKSGVDFGAIKSLQPAKRGTSGRLVELRIVGTGAMMTVGKELEIRRLLSRSHLYSSAFVVDTQDERNGVPGHFVLTGSGWGHGVGLCQIGAGVMGERGFTFGQILEHYYPGTQQCRLYA